MALVSATDIITDALDAIGVYAVGESISAADAATGLRRLNQLISSLSIQSLTIPVVSREVFSVTADVGTYTIGDGATFDTARPTNIQAAALLLNSSTPPIEIPSGLLTEQSYQAIAIKDQTNTQWTQVYYEATYRTTGYGTIILWPIPTTADNDLVLYIPETLAEFDDLTTQYHVPPGYEEMLGYNLAVRLSSPFSRPLPDEVARMAVKSLANIKRQNTPMVDLSNEFASIASRSYGYNIQTDGNQG